VVHHIFMPCYWVSHFHILHFHVLHFQCTPYSSLSDGMFRLQLIESHVIPNKALHSNILETLSLRNVLTPAVQGNIRLYHLNGACE